MKLLGGEEAPIHTSAKRLLIVDDEDSFTELIATYFSMNGYNATVAQSGKQAIEKLMLDRFDLMILDLVLGDMDGMDLLAQVNQTHPNFPVIIVTGLGYDEDLVQRAINEHAAGFVSKNLHLSQLLMEVRRVLAADPS